VPKSGGFVAKGTAIRIQQKTRLRLDCKRLTVIDDEKDFAYPHKFYQFNEVSGYYNSRLYQSKSG